MSDSDQSLGFDGSDAEDMDFEESYAPDEEDILKKQTYTILDSDKIAERVSNVVQETKEMFGLSIDEAITILRYFKYNIDKLKNSWFDDEIAIRKAAGIMPSGVDNYSSKVAI